MTTLEYWEEREKRHAQETKKSEDELAKKLHDRLDALMVEMDKQIHGFYSRYAKAEGITMAEAQQKVSQMDVKAFETKAKKYVKTRDFSKEANQELRLYNATMKINRLEMLKADMGLEMVDAFSDVEDMMRQGLTQCSLDEFERQAGILGVHNKDMTGKTDSIVNGSLNNATWSQRIWMYQDQLKSAVSDLLTNGIIQGRNPRDLARDLVKQFGATKYNAERLMHTEMCRVQIVTQMESFTENGYEQFVFISTEDSHVCAVCNSLNGEIFKVKDHAAGENAPPMHPNCRCSTAAFMDREELERELFVEENYVQNGQNNGIINIEIDELVPCLRDTKTGEIVDTLVVKVNSRSELKGFNKKNGWYVNWNQAPKDVEIYKLLAKNSSEVQGLIGIVPKDDHKAVYLHWAVAAPHNNPLISGQKRYEGVGGHLFAIAAEQSVKAGYGGALYGFAANKELVELYVNKYGAKHLPIEHRYEIFFEEQAAMTILKEYTYEFKE